MVPRLYCDCISPFSAASNKEGISEPGSLTFNSVSGCVLASLAITP